MADGAEMEPPPAEPAAPLEPISFSVLAVLKEAQGQHGLKHGDYTRYRQYCARRLRRLYKSLKFLHGKGKYQKRSLSAHQVVDERYFMMMLATSERAWSYAMELKNDGEGAAGKRSRHHLIGRLSKASYHAADLARLCAERGDTRTALEAEAYSSWMGGNVLLERETDWQGALAKFLRARTVYEQLGKVGELEQQAVCRQRLEELEPSIRYCNYNLKKAGGGGDSMEDLLALQKAHGGMDLLQSKLDAVMSEARAQTVAAGGGVSQLGYRGRSVAVRSAAVQGCLTSAAEVEADITGLAADASHEERMVLYDKLFMAYNDAMRHVKDAVSGAASATGAEGDVKRDELAILERAVAGTLLERTMDRNWMMVDAAKAKTRAKPEGLVRLHDTLLFTLTELAESSPEDEDLHAECLARMSGVRAHRAWFVAKTYEGAGKYAEAFAVYQRAAEHAEAAEGSLGKLGMPTEALAALRREVAGARCAVHARGLTEAARSRDAVQEGLQGMRLDAAAKFDRAVAQFLSSGGLDEYRSYLGEAKGEAVSIAELPPRMATVPVRPIVLDLALDEVEYPDLSARGGSKPGEEKKSLTSRLFGWGR